MPWPVQCGPVTIRPPAAPLVAIAAGVAFVGTLPVMLLYAIFAAPLGGLAAWVLGVPLMRLALRTGLRGGVSSVLVGAGAAALAPTAGLLVLTVLTLAQGGGPGWAEVGRSLPQSVTAAGPIAAAFGAATALIYWARYIAIGWTPRHLLVISMIAVGAISGVFAASHEVGRLNEREQAERFTADLRRQPSPDGAASVRLIRLVDLDAGAVRLASPDAPACAVVVHSPELAAHIPVGTTVRVDLSLLRATPGGFRLMRVGTVADPALLANARVEHCRPWH